MKDQETTFVMLKPDALQRNLVGELIRRFEKKGLQIVALKLDHIGDELARDHYSEHQDKPFFEGLIEFITAAPVVLMALTGRDAVSQVRTIVGATDPPEAEPGSIRGDYAVDVPKNLIHAADSPETAERELELFFDEDDFVEWEETRIGWLYEHE